ncbi:class I SAM-dependent methyltransferase [Aspergillus clavatus NRRL 1]|uniref:Methyltransferase type 12 domain-containing protein n=1 Tax=Aspergillus clavatus (strain ATCC 1007 / CBS 513.65 / DSM 816 / NCTC 3887 / NRRL 1 / QM 1276 / 107) TaxID=344612 RepID=A1CD25_ASPCL|nr:uncharacterized protein ACLA_064030 [Aspergillus clavatus NRRL 1]EAW12432.1 conserved hypothetical protein [Aspergillus clavatus NRRL 1]
MANSTARSGFHLANGKPYMLERNYLATARLNYQHYLFRECVGFNLHPSIPVPSKARIADVATGTAIWLFDVARDFPGASLHGLDVSLDSAPSVEWLPRNVTLRKWDIFDDAPPELIGAYDVVHLRFFMLVVRDSDPAPVIRNVSQLLKPGGWIQWDEFNYRDAHIISANVKVEELAAMEQLRQFAYSDGRNNWTLEIAQYLQNHGFARTQLFQYHDPLERAKANNEQYIMCLEEFARRLDHEGERKDAREVYELIGKISDESQTGSALLMGRIVCIGRKETEEERLWG